MRDLRMLPKLRDSWSYLYVEHCRVDQEDKAVAFHDAAGKIPVPCATLAVLMLGPGTSITHAAIRVLAETGCSVLWTGEHGIRFYAQGLGENRSSEGLLRQARLCSDPELRLKVIIKMYETRFGEPLPPGLTLQQIRGREGARVREAYSKASRETGIPWSGRCYDRGRWDSADAVNRAVSAANSCLYGICQAAIVSLGYSPGLGFIHTGKQLSFVYDIADLYKVDTTIPVAFRATASAKHNLEQTVRRMCRDMFVDVRLLERVVTDIERLLCPEDTDNSKLSDDFSDDPARPAPLWDPHAQRAEDGVDRSDARMTDENEGGVPVGADCP